MMLRSNEAIAFVTFWIVKGSFSSGKAAVSSTLIPEGGLLVMEEATTIDGIPASAKASILEKVADGKLRMGDVHPAGATDHV
jgi:hypothetical protein